MFDFFVKKKFLVDYLDGFTDIHNHILPGIDDGAKTVAESLSLIQGMGAFGITNFICTPHIMENYYPNTPKSINSSLALLKNSSKTNKLTNVRIRLAAEHMIDSGFESLLEKNEFMPLDGNYILIEMSYLQPSINFDVAIQKIADKNLFPILAHPERYVFLQNNLDKYERIKSKGLLYQLNFLSLGGYYGKHVQKTAHTLLKLNMIDFIATDVHNLNQLKHLKEIKISSRLLNLLLPVIERTSNTFI
ncbi:tyrosine-protein phosphatase [Maribacter antarcticus]|uniref:tyrosine-protein phosphatase n=1 Tax=Maribacter antarcticus TaxID=505250 RepID=UPI00047B7BA0|nr:CpsB/CapC family capsule biosynthesis tyrosine phosphatase [Maribacter antarcticus]